MMHLLCIEALGFPWCPEMVCKGVLQVCPVDVEMAEELRCAQVSTLMNYVVFSVWVPY